NSINFYKSPSLNNVPKNNVDSNKLNVGLKVKHKDFGIGTIVSMSKVSDDIKLTIAFDRRGVKILMLSMAPIEAV
ncbi:ATP-dependent DNA helicase PcrA, partial [Clostridium botulinum]|nr:ATP-dependent DNA helicase PcrA [Clostridium botulinum]